MGLLPPVTRLRAGSLAHAAHTLSPGWGECFVWALQVSQCGHPRSVTVHPQMVREYRRLFLPSEDTPGTDDPSAPVSSSDAAVDGS